MMKNSDYFRLLLLGAIWGASFLFMKIAAPALGAISTAFFRVLLGAIGLALILVVLKTRRDFNGKFSSTLLLGVINSGVPFLMYGLAAKLLPAGYSAIFNATTPLMGVLIGCLFFQEQITVKKALGVATGIGGVVLLTATGPVAFNLSVVLGALACLVATSCYGAAGFLTKRWITERGGLDAKLVAFGSQIGATMFLAPCLAGSAAMSTQAWGDRDVWLALAALGLICTAWGYILYFRLIADIGPLRSLTVTFLIPPFGVLWGKLFLGEQVTLAHLAGGTLIAIALYLVLGQSKRAAALPEAGIKRSDA